MSQKLVEKGAQLLTKSPTKKGIKDLADLARRYSTEAMEATEEVYTKAKDVAHSFGQRAKSNESFFDSATKHGKYGRRNSDPPKYEAEEDGFIKFAKGREECDSTPPGSPTKSPTGSPRRVEVERKYTREDLKPVKRNLFKEFDESAKDIAPDAETFYANHGRYYPPQGSGVGIVLGHKLTNPTMYGGVAHYSTAAGASIKFGPQKTFMSTLAYTSSHPVGLSAINAAEIVAPFASLAEGVGHQVKYDWTMLKYNLGIVVPQEWGKFVSTYIRPYFMGKETAEEAVKFENYMLFQAKIHPTMNQQMLYPPLKLLEMAVNGESVAAIGDLLSNLAASLGLITLAYAHSDPGIDVPLLKDAAMHEQTSGPDAVAVTGGPDRSPEGDSSEVVDSIVVLAAAEKIEAESSDTASPNWMMMLMVGPFAYIDKMFGFERHHKDTVEHEHEVNALGFTQEEMYKVMATVS